MKEKQWIGGLVVLVVISVIGYLFLSGSLFQPQEAVVREFSMTAKQFEFSPTRIEVNKGETVILKITGLDDGIGNGHGFAIPDFGIDEVIRRGQTVTIKFVANKKGTFAFSCSVSCGSGHSGMRGTLVVG